LTGMVTSSGNTTTVVTNANLTGDVTSVGNVTTLAASTVTGKLLTGYVAGTAGALAATDTVLGAFQKLNASIVAGPTLTGEVTSVGNATTVTNAAVIGKTLTGYAKGAGTVSSSDSILGALQKLDGNVAALGTGTAQTSAATASTLVLRDASAGAAFGALTATSINFGATSLNYYEEFQASTSFWQNNDGDSTLGTLTTYIVRVGRVVTLLLLPFSLATTKKAMWGCNSTTVLPTRFVPIAGWVKSVSVTCNGVITLCVLYCNGSTLTISPTTAGTVFSAAPVVFGGDSVSWVVA